MTTLADTRLVWDAMMALPNGEVLYNRSPSFRLAIKQLEAHVVPALRAGSPDGHMIRLAVEAMVRGFAEQAEETDRRHRQLVAALSTPRVGVENGRAVVRHPADC